ncbi:malate dehydrogenase [Haematococcus lacustris]
MDRLQNISSQLAPSAGGGRRVKVAVLGAAGGIGQPLSMLLKMNPLVGELALYDVANTPGVACDLSHMSTPAVAKGYVGADQLPAALQGCQLVVIPAGVPRKPGMTRDDLFNINAGIVAGLCEAVARHCPTAWLAIISNPVNSTVPIAAEVLKRAGVYDPKRLFGVTTLDVVRAETFIANMLQMDPRDVRVPVVGGHAGVTILPLLSQAHPPLQLSADQAAKLTKRIQDAGTEVVEAKSGTGSATLSMAYAAARFAESCLRAQLGEAGVQEYAYVQSTVLPGLPFFSSKLRLDTRGVAEVCGLGRLSGAEEEGLAALKAELSSSIAKGVAFVEQRAAASAAK